jgi:hypothetical protein
MTVSKLIKPNPDKSIVINNIFTPDRVQTRLINKLYMNIMNSDHSKSYDKSYHTQIYDLRYIATKIIYFLHHHSSWRALGTGWENVYAHFQKWSKWGIIDSTFKDLCDQYKIKRGYLKVVMTDTSIILNKNGSDCISRNPLVKNKNCTKLLSIVDNKGVTLFVDYFPGSKNDGKCLLECLENFLSENIGIITFLADSGFYTNEIIDLLKKHDVKPLIAKNVRNSKKHKAINKNKKIKLTYAQKVARQLEDMTKREKNLFKKRGKIENSYASFKQIPRFNVRYDKLIKYFHALSLIYFCEQIIKHL